MSAPTSGEWYEEDRGERIVVLAPGYDQEIASIDVCEGEPQEETQRANARLIAASRALLVAMEQGVCAAQDEMPHIPTWKNVREMMHHPAAEDFFRDMLNRYSSFVMATFHRERKASAKAAVLP